MAHGPLHGCDDGNPDDGQEMIKTKPAKKHYTAVVTIERPAPVEPAKPAPVVSTSEPDTFEAKRMITLRIDQDIIDWFKASGRGYQTRINAALRQFVENRK